MGGSRAGTREHAAGKGKQGEKGEAEEVSPPLEGRVAPDFTLPDDTGSLTTLKSFRGKRVVVYFIPKAGSPGCVEQACALKPIAKKLGLAVIGIAPDSLRKLANFRKKHGLPFTLLSDSEQKVANQYGVWVEKKMYGHTFKGMERVTLILDERGRIVTTIRGTPKSHAAQVAAALG
jgi:peroxiredoxin Q/BCP